MNKEEIQGFINSAHSIVKKYEIPGKLSDFIENDLKQELIADKPELCKIKQDIYVLLCSNFYIYAFIKYTQYLFGVRSQNAKKEIYKDKDIKFITALPDYYRYIIENFREQIINDVPDLFDETTKRKKTYTLEYLVNFTF